jgi:HEAT repeat protein
LSLDAATLARFVRDGYVVVQTGLPREFHAEVCQRAGEILDREGNWGNNILPRLPELQHVLADPAVNGALSSLLGESYALHPHRYCHRNEPGSAAQQLHKDTREFSGDRHFRHVRPRWLIGFYYPHDVSEAMGPTAILPGSAFYLEQPDRGTWPELAIRARGGSFAIVHSGLWHRATANRGTRPRYMFKFLFARMDEPSPGGTCPTVEWQASESPAPHVGLWSRTFGWLQGDGQLASSASGVAPSRGALRSGDVRARRAAADDFALAPTTAAISQLAEALSDVDEPVRYNAAQALANTGDAAVSVLDAALRTPVGPARRYAAHALSELGPAAVDVLIERTRDTDDQVSINAIDALGNMGAQAAPAEPALREALHAENAWRRRHAGEALGLLGPQAMSAVPDLADALDDEQPWVRFNVAIALARIGPAAAVATPALIDTLNDPERYARGWAAEALRRIGTPTALAALADHLLLARWCWTTRPDDRY